MDEANAYPNRRTGCAPCGRCLIANRLATLATWFITLIIQRAEDRDTQALQAKLDELFRVNKAVSNEMTKVDSLEPEEISGCARAILETAKARPPRQPVGLWPFVWMATMACHSSTVLAGSGSRTTY